jgi:hypothetical protein
MKHLYVVAILSLFLLVSACNYITYTPRNKNQVRREKPSLLIYERIVDFRLDQGRWPATKEDLITKGKKYYEAFDGFKYNYTHFKIKDSNTMTFYFSDHVADRANYDQTQLIDVNAYGGQVRFFKVKDKYAWKIKMN